MQWLVVCFLLTSIVHCDTTKMVSHPMTIQVLTMNLPTIADSSQVSLPWVTPESSPNMTLLWSHQLVVFTHVSVMCCLLYLDLHHQHCGLGLGFHFFVVSPSQSPPRFASPAVSAWISTYSVVFLTVSTWHSLWCLPAWVSFTVKMSEYPPSPSRS